MKLLIIPTLLINFAYAGVTQVYGTDDRTDLDRITDKTIQSLGISTAAMFDSSTIKETESGYQLYNKSLGETQKMCVGEKFANQPASSKCSGFLVAPNLLMTAGHCLIAQMVPDYILNPEPPKPYRDPMDDPFDIDIEDILNPPPTPVTTRIAPDQSSQEFMDKIAKMGCEARKWVFDYNYINKNDATKVSKNSVYGCKSVKFVKYSEDHTADYALIELDRDVLNINGSQRAPLKLNLKSKRKVNQEVFMIGHPAGLPSKFTENARVIKKENSDQLKVVIDSFGGNSGSAIFDKQTNEIVGILIRGHNDYYHVDTHETDRFGSKKQCLKVYVCEQENDTRCNGEVVFNLKSLPRDIKKTLNSL